MGIVEHNIKEFLNERGATLGWLAEKIGMSKSGFYKMIEAGSIKVEVLQKIAEVLDKPITSFFTHIKVGDKRLEELESKTVNNIAGHILFATVINSFKALKTDIENNAEKRVLLSKVNDSISTYEDIYKMLFDEIIKDVIVDKPVKPNQ